MAGSCADRGLNARLCCGIRPIRQLLLFWRQIIFACYKTSLPVRAAYSERACLECVSEEAIPSTEDLIMTLNSSKTLLVLSASILLAVTCAALAKTVAAEERRRFSRSGRLPLRSSQIFSPWFRRRDRGQPPLERAVALTVLVRPRRCYERRGRKRGNGRAVLGRTSPSFSGFRSSGLHASNRGPHVHASGTSRARAQPISNCRGEW